MLIGAGIVGIAVGIIVLCIEYRTNWFARTLISPSKKQARIKSSAKQLPSQKTNLTKGRRNSYTSISNFLKKKWWIGVGALAGVMLLILAIAQFILPGFGNQVASPPPSDIGVNSQQTPQPSEEPAIKYREHPSPTEIKNEIEVQPLLQQKNTGDSFVGLKVQWQLILASIDTSYSDPNMITLVLWEESSLFPDVKCDIDIREYPESNRAKQGDGVFVKGEISKAEKYHIELINCTVEFDLQEYN
jgi:hypothetical protein